jgi:hypothetical protein
MNNKTQDRAELVQEALELLRVIDVAHGEEDIDDDPFSRQKRMMLRAAARRLVATIVAELREPVAEPLPNSFLAAAA